MFKGVRTSFKSSSQVKFYVLSLTTILVDSLLWILL